MRLEWGNQILDAVRQFEVQENLVLIVRHSERPSFDGIPYEQWRHVELTEKGIQVARSFGKVLSSSTKTMRVHHWGLKRVVMTAEAISIGARESGIKVHGPTPIPLRHPISNQEEYDRNLRSKTWEAFLNAWLKGAEQSAMIPADRYAREIYRDVLREKSLAPDGITIVTTHDLYLMPLINYIYHPSSPWIDFLDGVAIKIHKDKVSMSFGGDVRHLSLEELHGMEKALKPQASSQINNKRVTT